MQLTDDQLLNLIQELEIYEFRVRSKMKRLKDEMGLTKKHRSRIHDGRVLLGEIQESIRNFKSGNMEKGLDGVWNLTQKKLKFKTIIFPPNHKTFRQLRKESIQKNPEHLIKRSKSHGSGYRKLIQS